MPNVVVYLYLLVLAKCLLQERRASKERDEQKGVLVNLPFGGSTSDWILAAGNVMFCCHHEKGGLRNEKGRCQGRLLAATALPMHLTLITPMTSGFSAALAREAPVKSTTSRLSAWPVFSPLRVTWVLLLYFTPKDPEHLLLL